MKFTSILATLAAASSVVAAPIADPAAALPCFIFCPKTTAVATTTSVTVPLASLQASVVSEVEEAYSTLAAFVSSLAAHPTAAVPNVVLSVISVVQDQESAISSIISVIIADGSGPFATSILAQEAIIHSALDNVIAAATSALTDPSPASAALTIATAISVAEPAIKGAFSQIVSLLISLFASVANPSKVTAALLTTVQGILSALTNILTIGNASGSPLAAIVSTVGLLVDLITQSSTGTNITSSLLSLLQNLLGGLFSS
ncbi:hypothetical protein BABINDRAFT_82047 [Babjeviella inositovora NRRL Y-12698]|uniref:Uncharacterized protein n=1 Tax=Babjeviella inositovora NRRL Y-12698 TaxID=984486 RepID=A0A1E3R074_9ASCO|nr:uncharacterized protein BABINDRAFT_82047 [Babjeviella inositovora NRRL Y-12698]ODQ83204.1 hypothetical protein BABINDRAFT_82047 [Babjeviella inositovora NRRL Y-12698]